MYSYVRQVCHIFFEHVSSDAHFPENSRGYIYVHLQQVWVDTHSLKKVTNTSVRHPFPSLHPQTDGFPSMPYANALAEMEGVPRVGGGLAVADEVDYWAAKPGGSTRHTALPEHTAYLCSRSLAWL